MSKMSLSDFKLCRNLQIVLAISGVAIVIFIGCSLKFAVSSSMNKPSGSSRTGDHLIGVTLSERDNSAGKNERATGYILVSEYADQMTGASYALLSLQCWAGAVSKRVKIVEPFVFTGSGLGYTFEAWEGHLYKKLNVQSDNEMRLGDLFDLEKWWRQTVRLGGRHSYAPIEDWMVFLNSAPTNLIVVGKSCPRGQGDSCNQHFYEAVRIFAIKKGFRIVKTVKIETTMYSFDKFKKLIYGNFNPSKTVVLFQQWGGILPHVHLNRYSIAKFERCYKGKQSIFLFEPSMKIIKDSKKYINEYLPEHGKTYISVMLRTERIGLRRARGKSPGFKKTVFNQCLMAIKKEVQSIAKTHNTSGIFVTMDSSNYGSRVFRNNSAPLFLGSKFLNNVNSKLFKILKPYGNEMTIEKWDKSFDAVSSFHGPGYIAQMQKNLAASGRCLVTAGGGTFQSSAKLLYESKHPRTADRCTVNVKDC